MKGIPFITVILFTVQLFTVSWAVAIDKVSSSGLEETKRVHKNQQQQNGNGSISNNGPNAQGIFSLVLYLLSAGTGNKSLKQDKGIWIQPGSEFKTFAYYSGAAYQLKGKKWDCVPSCQFPETAGTVVDFTWHNKSPASVGFVAHNDRARIIVVSFRGSVDTQDWIQDSEFTLDSWPSSIPGSMVHHGFLSAYRSVAKDVTETVKRLAKKFSTYKVVFTGHSLGGAETVLCAIDTLEQMPDMKNRTFVYTYGMPRIGNDAWADGVDRLQLPIYRMVYESDLVPHIPFQWLGYQHLAQEVWIHRNRTHFCGKAQESLTCSAGVTISDLNIQDHSRYTSGLWDFALLSS